MYFSFTDPLVKTDLSGRPIGSVSGFTGHLGDLDLDTGDAGSTAPARRRRSPHQRTRLPDGKFFACTGNTTSGVQNLKYDRHSGNWLMAVYRGRRTASPPTRSTWWTDRRPPAGER